MKKLFTRTVLVLAALLMIPSSFISAADNTSTPSYYQFKVENGDVPFGNKDIVIKGKDYSKIEDGNAKVSSYLDEKDVLLTSDVGFVEYQINSEEPALYNIEITYCAMDKKDNAIKRSIEINGKGQHTALSAIVFHRLYENELDKPLKDNRGHELRPNQVQVQKFISQVLYEPSYNTNDPLTVKLEAGVNTLRISAISESLAIKEIRLFAKDDEKSYKEVSSSYGKSDGKEELIHIEAEDAVYKSDKSLYPLCDGDNPLNSPVSLNKTVMNMIGGKTWCKPLQYIEWNFNVEKTGLYKLVIRGKQNFVQGQISERRLYIDGEVPFKEANQIEFDYNVDFQDFVVGNKDKAYVFYLEKGKHTLRLENNVGKVGSILEQISHNINDINDIYKQVFMITGAYPDVDRDYNIGLSLPELQNEIKAVYEKQEALKKEYLALTNIKGNGYSYIDKIQIQLDEFMDDIEKLPSKLDTFRVNISNLSSWLLEATNQPLLLDYINFVPADDEIKDSTGNFFQNTYFGIKKFFVSFFEDYNSISVSENTDEEITVWLGTGRDQAEALKTIVTNDFIPNKGIGVNIRLVDINVLLPAVAVGNGPDVALSLERSLVMNYAYRGAVEPISNFKDFADVQKKFLPESLTELRYRDTYYGLPDKYSFYMMFYRKDIMNNLGLEIPETWDDIYTILPKLQNNHMTVGFPDITANTTDIFTSLLYQNGGNVYDDQLNKCVLDEKNALNAFKQFTDFYKKYGVYLKIDPLSYFRTGQTPILLMPYTFFANIEAGAPELNGVWDFKTMPGLVKEDGTVDYTASGTSTGCCIFSNSKHKEASWEFLKWFTDAPAQTAYGNEMESIQGLAGRYSSASMEAISDLPWDKDQLARILDQAEHSKAMPEAPGGYMTNRYIVTATLTVVKDGLIPRETLMDYTKVINDEVMAMRKEFGLDD